MEAPIQQWSTLGDLFVSGGPNDSAPEISPAVDLISVEQVGG